MTFCDQRYFYSLMGGNRGQGDGYDAVVLGMELAAAAEAEKRRLATRRSIKSPMPRERYPRAEFDLLTPTVLALDSKLASLSRQFAKCRDQKRTAMRAAISMAEFYTLLTFAQRAAVFAIRERDTAWAVAGLTAVAVIEAERVDWRDILVALGLLHHAAGRVGLDADRLLKKLRRLAEPGTAELIDGFRKRPRCDKDLSAWGYEEAETAQGIGLIQGGFGGTKPTYDLVTLASEIAGYLVTDKYEPSSLDFGEAMPRVWLESHDNAALDRALKAIRAGVAISAALRPIKGVKHQAQHFVIFVQEMKSDAAARQLWQIARRTKPTFYCKVELLAARLFCLIVARSCWEGVRAYETPTSLARFSRPIGDILRRHASSAVSA